MRRKLYGNNSRQISPGLRRRWERKLLRSSTILLLAVLGSLGMSAWAQKATSDLTEIGLEKLMDMEVTSVSKKEQKLLQAPAAIYVITAEDIRRSGATNIPDLLRMVPGVDVAQVDANAWAVNIRGFSNRYSDKVLVLIDGRSVYTPVFSGVRWDQQDVPLEDIERIEVIRGPGGTVWGANAVNGVINIITKTAKATPGGLLSAGGGSSEAGQGLVQYGGKVGQKGAYRAFGNFFHVGDSGPSDAGPAADSWHMLHGGFRSDWELSPRDAVTVQGDLFKANEGQTISTFVPGLLQPVSQDSVSAAGGNILGRWDRTLSNGSDMSLQAYYDRYNRLDLGLREIMNTVDLDFHHRFLAGSRQEIVWGLGYRVNGSNLIGGFGASFAPPQRTDQLFSMFVQDQIKLTRSVSIVLGSKFEHNAYTGFELEPSAQLLWTPTARQTVWFTVARAIRQPSIADIGVSSPLASFTLPNGLLGILTVEGNPKLQALSLRDYEIGYRAQINERWSLDIATYYSRYRQIETLEPGAPVPSVNAAGPYLVLPVVFGNKAHTNNYGGEINATWSVTSRWRLSPGFSAIHTNGGLDPSSLDTLSVGAASTTPQYRFQIRSLLSLPRHLDWDNSLYYVSGLPDGVIPQYTRLDTRLGWRVGEFTEFSIVGQNLLRPQHLEFENAYQVHSTQVKRSVFAKITLKF